MITNGYLSTANVLSSVYELNSRNGKLSKYAAISYIFRVHSSIGWRMEMGCMSSPEHYYELASELFIWFVIGKEDVP